MRSVMLKKSYSIIALDISKADSARKFLNTFEFEKVH